MIVISNTSPIINLAVVGQLDLIKKLYGQVVIPQAVYDEIVVVGAGQPGSSEVQTGVWVQVEQVTDRNLVTALRLDLDVGEAEAIALAIQLKADLLLMDERRGRNIAARFQLKTVGLLGVLIEAKSRGLLRAVKPVMDELLVKAAFRVSKDLHDRVLKSAGE